MEPWSKQDLRGGRSGSAFGLLVSLSMLCLQLVSREVSNEFSAHRHYHWGRCRGWCWDSDQTLIATYFFLTGTHPQMAKFIFCFLSVTRTLALNHAARGPALRTSRKRPPYFRMAASFITYLTILLRSVSQSVSQSVKKLCGLSVVWVLRSLL